MEIGANMYQEKHAIVAFDACKSSVIFFCSWGNRNQTDMEDHDKQLQGCRDNHTTAKWVLWWYHCTCMLSVSYASYIAMSEVVLLYKAVKPSKKNFEGP